MAMIGLPALPSAIQGSLRVARFVVDHRLAGGGAAGGGQAHFFFGEGVAVGAPTLGTTTTWPNRPLATLPAPPWPPKVAPWLVAAKAPSRSAAYRV
jgi:hypothetical protein